MSPLSSTVCYVSWELTVQNSLQIILLTLDAPSHSVSFIVVFYIRKIP